ncbi:meiotic recombination protein DMC1 homolog [Dioscorea cayenensis subsp. rotundata]|uniref:Meiotic recombination protein DMC1 homolog n=1 Tax=Dioscorea cayennensis subsp. rotundata TaxID=55577 RepID=A0AB40B9Q0_DIOCR|nr:meiotic recombination protein DMC1 homolog [Dioscorea cayenensis subsp. rotundata]
MNTIAHMNFFDEDDYFKLIAQGIEVRDIKKLPDARIYTINDLMVYTKMSLTVIKGLSVANVNKIWEAAEKLVNVGYETGSDLLIKHKSIIKIASGSQALDKFLGDRIETPIIITKVFGAKAKILKYHIIKISRSVYKIVPNYEPC